LSVSEKTTLAEQLAAGIEFSVLRTEIQFPTPCERIMDERNVTMSPEKADLAQ
jgi:hypothetical protein